MTPQERLDAALEAEHRLLIGARVVELRADGYLTRYDRANLPALRAYIARLRAEIAGRPTQGGIGFTF